MFLAQQQTHLEFFPKKFLVLLGSNSWSRTCGHLFKKLWGSVFLQLCFLHNGSVYQMD